MVPAMYALLFLPVSCRESSGGLDRSESSSGRGAVPGQPREDGTRHFRDRFRRSHPYCISEKAIHERGCEIDAQARQVGCLKILEMPKDPEVAGEQPGDD